MDRELINIIPGARIVIVCLRTVLIIIAVFIMATNCVVKETCAIKWLESVSTVCIMINLIYILSLCYITSIKKNCTISIMMYFIGYLLLIISSIPMLLMLLCGTDYLLFEILYWYIFYESDMMILPVSTLIFITITYWLPIIELTRVAKTYYKYKQIKLAYE